MMAVLFLVFALAMVAVIYNNRKASITLIVMALLFSLVMFWHHATSILEINW